MNNYYPGVSSYQAFSYIVIRVGIFQYLFLYFWSIKGLSRSINCLYRLSITNNIRLFNDISGKLIVFSVINCIH